MTYFIRNSALTNLLTPKTKDALAVSHLKPLPLPFKNGAQTALFKDPVRTAQ
jgi:hypothetical protein